MTKSKSAIDMTARWLERLKSPESDRIEYFDENVHGLGLRVSATGHKAWFVMFRIKGDTRVRRKTIGTYPEIPLADARDLAKEALLHARRGEDPTDDDRDARRSPTVRKLVDDFIERYAKVNLRSWEAYQWALEKDVIPAWSGRKASSIKRKDVIDLLDSIRERKAPIQANRVLQIVRKMYNWAISRDILENNPCIAVQPVAKERQRQRVLTEDEIRALWDAFGVINERLEILYKIRLVTAQRGWEVQTMRWKDVDLEAGWWTIPETYTKNKLSHRVPLSPQAIRLLQRLHNRTGHQEWAFPSRTARGRHIIDPCTASRKVEELSKVHDFVPHDLRRTAASYMTGIGFQRLVVSKILNHVEPGVTKVYDRHSYDPEKREALNAWADKLEEILGGEIQ